MQQLSTLQAYNIKFDSSLLKEQEKPLYYRFNIIPWQKLNNTTFFIVEDISQDIKHWVKANMVLITY
jgi:hypothetical protein